LYFSLQALVFVGEGQFHRSWECRGCSRIP